MPDSDKKADAVKDAAALAASVDADGFIARTGPLLFARVTEHDAYLTQPTQRTPRATVLRKIIRRGL